MRLLVVNTGSSSLKLRVLDADDAVLAADDLGPLEGKDLRDRLAGFLAAAPPIDAAGHRIAHGGALYRRPVLVDDGVDAAIGSLADLAPLHNPPALALIRALRDLRPALAQVACFDTAFHAGMPPEASTYAVPRAWRERWGVRRYGFHGLSHSWASRRAGDLLGTPREGLRLVTAHLGGGASLAAVAFGRSVDTTMGFTPLEGLVMATRSGTVDPGLLLWVQRHGDLAPEAMEHALEHDSGLLGLSGLSGDLREVMAAADRGDPDARLAYGTYVHRLRTGIGAMAAAMDGLDALVFTGGAGEGSPRLRADTCSGLSHLGLPPDGLDPYAAGGDGVISPPGARTAVVVVRAREDREIAASVRAVLAG